MFTYLGSSPTMISKAMGAPSCVGDILMRGLGGIRRYYKAGFASEGGGIPARSILETHFQSINMRANLFALISSSTSINKVCLAVISLHHTRHVLHTYPRSRL